MYHFTYFFMFGLYRDIRPFQWSMLKVVYLICIQTMVLDQIIYIYVDDQKLYSFYFVFALEWTIYVNEYDTYVHFICFRIRKKLLAIYM